MKKSKKVTSETRFSSFTTAGEFSCAEEETEVMKTEAETIPTPQTDEPCMKAVR